MPHPAISGEPIRLVYAVSDADQRAAIRAIVMAEPQVRWIRLAMLVLPFVMIAWSVSSGWSLGTAIVRNLFWIVSALLGLFAYLPLTVRSIVKAMRRADPGWDREQMVSLGADGIRLESAAETTAIPWSSVRRASETGEVVLIHIGAGRVLYLPIRIVASQADLGALRDLLRARLGPNARLREGRDC
jgi:hypothetical protein